MELEKPLHKDCPSSELVPPSTNQQVEPMVEDIKLVESEVENEPRVEESTRAKPELKKAWKIKLTTLLKL